MSKATFPPELERRIQELEKPEGQGSGFTSADWIFLLLTGVVGPALLLVWGWN